MGCRAWAVQARVQMSIWLHAAHLVPSNDLCKHLGQPVSNAATAFAVDEHDEWKAEHPLRRGIFRLVGVGWTMVLLLFGTLQVLGWYPA